MSEQPSINARGAVDLSALADSGSPRPADAQQGEATSHDSWVIAAEPAQLQQLVQLSAQVPVLVLIHGQDDLSGSFRTQLSQAVDAQGGRVLLAEINAAASAELSQQVGQLPVVTAFLGSQPIAELDSSTPPEQLGQLVSQVLQLATQNGITGTVPPQSRRETAEQQQEPEKLPPLHQEAIDALERSDYAAAVQAYEKAIREKPDDSEAKLGLAQVRLMQRTESLDLTQVREEAANNPSDVEAQKRTADVDVLGGHVEDAFNRLIRFIQSHFGDDREAARQHLVELYSIVGDSDPRVSASRRLLARALF